MATNRTSKPSTTAESKPRSAGPRAATKKTAAKSATAKKPAGQFAAKFAAKFATKKPATRPAAKSAAKPAGKPVAKSVAKPASRPAAKSAAKPAVKRPVAKRPVAKPAPAPIAAAPKQRKTAKASNAPTDIVERLRGEVKRALEELKAKDIVEIDVRGKTSIADYIVIASGTSTRHVKSVSDEVAKYAKKIGVMPLGVEGQREGEWVLVDLGDIVVHVQLPRVREFYGLERLWTVGDHEEREAAFG